MSHCLQGTSSGDVNKMIHSIMSIGRWDLGVWGLFYWFPARKLDPIGKTGVGHSPRIMAAISSTSSSLARLILLYLGKSQAPGNMRPYWSSLGSLTCGNQVSCKQCFCILHNSSLEGKGLQTCGMGGNIWEKRAARTLI